MMLPDFILDGCIVPIVIQFVVGLLPKRTWIKILPIIGTVLFLIVNLVLCNPQVAQIFSISTEVNYKIWLTAPQYNAIMAPFMLLSQGFTWGCVAFLKCCIKKICPIVNKTDR